MGLRAMPLSQGQGQVQQQSGAGGVKSMQPPQVQQYASTGGVPWNLAAQMVRSVQPQMPTRNIQPVRNTQPVYGQPTTAKQYGQALAGSVSNS